MPEGSWGSMTRKFIAFSTDKRSPTLFQPTVSILNFQPKADVALMCATMLSVLVFLIWSLLNSLLYGLNFLATLQLNLSVLSTYLLTLQTIQNSSTILTPKWNTSILLLPSSKSSY